MSQSQTPSPFTEPSGTSRQLVQQLLEHVKTPKIRSVNELADPSYQLELARQVGRREIAEELARALKIGDTNGI